jgi:hypothetical protein
MANSESRIANGIALTLTLVCFRSLVCSPLLVCSTLLEKRSWFLASVVSRSAAARPSRWEDRRTDRCPPASALHLCTYPGSPPREAGRSLDALPDIAAKQENALTVLPYDPARVGAGRLLGTRGDGTLYSGERVCCDHPARSRDLFGVRLPDAVPGC